MLRIQDIWSGLMVSKKIDDRAGGSVVHSLRITGTEFPILEGRYRDKPWFTAGSPDNFQSPIAVGIASVIGKRSNNEDTGLVFLGEIASGRRVIPLCFAVVADGMGGHWGGEYASSIAAETLSEQVIEHLIRGDEHEALEELDETVIRDTLTDAMQSAHAMVQQNVPGGGTTATCLLMVDDAVFIAHVGDCRVYILHDGALDLVTRDHSYKAALEDRGVTLANSRAPREILYRAIGMNGALEVDNRAEWLGLNYSLLMCSDGLWSALDKREMTAIIASSDDPQTACDQLVMSSIAAGGFDNSTAVIIQPQN